MHASIKWEIVREPAAAAAAALHALYQYFSIFALECCVTLELLCMFDGAVHS